MLDIGRVCVKIAGRDSNRVCAIVEIIDEKYVLIDGDVRRKKVNALHIEPTQKMINIQKGASTEAVQKELTEIGFEMHKKGEPKKTSNKPLSKRALKSQEVKEKPQKATKKAAKKVAAKPKVAKEEAPKEE